MPTVPAFDGLAHALEASLYGMALLAVICFIMHTLIACRLLMGGGVAPSAAHVTGV